MVVDASVVVELLLGSRAGAAAAAAIGDSDGVLHAPDLLDVEVPQAFRRLVSVGSISEARGAGAVDLLPSVPARRAPVGPLVPRMWALKETLSAYAGAYVALAEALGCPLLTCDARLGRAPGHRADVRVVG
jgi:predicted nucleic acid-binding protein